MSTLGNSVPQANPASTVLSGTVTGNTAPQNRGRGRFPRGRGRVRSATTANRAQAQINRDANPVQLDNKFSGFTSLNRGNAKVTINQGFTEIIANDYSNTIKAVQSAKGFYDNNGAPMDADYLTRGTGAGLCLSSALKLIHATPSSQQPSIANVQSFSKYSVHVPKSFIQILDLMGKNDFQDWVIRVEDNHDLIQRLLLKALKYCKQNADFMAEYDILGNAANRGRFDGLDNVQYTDFDNVFFSTNASVKRIKARAKMWLDTQLRQVFHVTVGTVQVAVSYPQLPSDNPSSAEIQTWLNHFVNGVHPNYNAVILTGSLLLLNIDWLRMPNAQMQVIDPTAFAGTPVAQNTPVQLLNACGLRHLSEFLTEKHFIEMSRGAFEYYEQTIVQRLHTIFALVQQGISTLGSPAQLITVPRDLVVERNTNGLPRQDLDPNLNHCLSFVKLDIAHAVTKSAMVGLVKEVELDPDYQGTFEGSLVSIRRFFLSRDGLMYSHQRQQDRV